MREDSVGADPGVPRTSNTVAATAHGDRRRLNAMSVDVEDYFHVHAFADLIDRSSWDDFPARVETNTYRLLNLMADMRASGTFFMLGWVADRFPKLVQAIVADGHELASHGHAHQTIQCQDRTQFRQDVRRSKAILEDISGISVRGYRAPSFSIRQDTWWAYDILEEEGYVYSSSVYPISHDHYGMPEASRVPFYPRQTNFLEIPLTTVRVLRRNWPAAGGGYFRLLPYGASAWSMRRVHKADGIPCVFYCHPWEVDPDQPRIRQARFKSRMRHYLNIERMHARLERLMRDFAWGRIDEVFLKGDVRKGD